MNERYDVFVSFKNLDEQGNPTQDAALARQIYDFLVARALKVFCANVSLEKLGISAFKRAIDKALDSAQILVAVGTTTTNLDSEWVRYEWDSFFTDVLSGIKPEGRVFVYVRGVPLVKLPRALRQSQVINDGPDSLERLFNFIANAISHDSSRQARPQVNYDNSALTGPSVANARQRLEQYAREHDNVFNIMWDSSKNHFDIELNGSSEWPSENPCDPKVLDELAKPWSVYRWYSD